MARRAGLGAGALGFLLAAGCGDSFTASSNGQGAGTTTSPEGTGAGGAASGQAGTGSAASGTGGEGGALACLGGNGCLACLEGADCKDEAAACSDDAACIELACCARNCGADDGDCFDGCVSGSFNGFSGAYLLAGCAFDHCQEQCAFKEDLSPCQVCTLQTCAPDVNACRNDEQCTIYYDCLQKCDGESCVDCDSGVGVGAKAAALKLDSCRFMQCSLARDPMCVLP